MVDSVETHLLETANGVGQKLALEIAWALGVQSHSSRYSQYRR